MSEHLDERRSRQRLLEAAARLLERDGLRDGLLAEAVALAGCDPDGARIFFPGDEDLVFAIYARIAQELETRVGELPPGSVVDRVLALLGHKLDLVAPYRSAFAAIEAVGLDAGHALGVLNPQTELIRHQNLAAFEVAVLGAEDAPAPDDANALVRSLYALHLALLLVWVRDPRDAPEATRDALAQARALLRDGRPPLDRTVGGVLLGDVDAHVGETILVGAEPAVDARATEILGRLLAHRRCARGAGACGDRPCPACLALHLPKVRRAVRAGAPVRCVLPAFPAKSPNPRKVLGTMPDLAEELALRHLQGICDEVAEVHPPGARMTICSDGRVFSDLVGVADEDVTRYGEEIRTLIERVGARSVDVFRLEDLFESEDHAGRRAHLLDHYAETVEVVRERTARSLEHRALYNGIHRFITEDRDGLEPGKSKNRVRKEAKERAYGVIRRSNAWSRVVTECFPAALRLSIHPQAPHADKIGILLGGEQDDVWLTPWHAVAVREGERFRLAHREDAEAAGARLVEVDGRPSHYEAAP